MKKLQILALFLTFSMTFIAQSVFAASHEKTIATETNKIIEAMAGDSDKKEVTSTEDAVEEKVEEVAEEKASEESTATETEASEENNKEAEDEEPDCD